MGRVLCRTGCSAADQRIEAESRGYGVTDPDELETRFVVPRRRPNH